MRFFIALVLALALGVMECGDGEGAGGSGGDAGSAGMAGVGGDGGSAGVGGGGVGGDGGSGGDLPNCPGIIPPEHISIRLQNADLFLCLPDDGGFMGTCLDESCVSWDMYCAEAEEGAYCVGDRKSMYIGLCVADSCVPECAVLENGDECNKFDAFDSSYVCRDGRCQRRCETDDDCGDYNDCTAETCLRNGLCEENGPVRDGSPCAGGTCQSGECVVESSILPCTDQGIRNAISTGGGPYTFACDGFTTLEPPMTLNRDSAYVVDKDVTLDGEGDLGLQTLVVRQAGVQANITGVTVERIGNYGGVLTVTNSTIHPWGIDSDTGTLTLIASTVSGVDGVSMRDGSLTIIDSTVSTGSGIDSYGPLTVVNSTVSGNGRTGMIAGGIRAWGPATLISTTVSGNLGAADIYADQSLTAINSIVDGRCSVSEEAGLIVSNGNNIESPGDTCGFDQSTDQVNVSADDLKLGELADNGGPTRTHALAEGSVAIDQIPAANCVDADGEALTTDQRGEARPGGTMCDVGAFEVQPQAPRWGGRRSRVAPPDETLTSGPAPPGDPRLAVSGGCHAFLHRFGSSLGAGRHGVR